MATQTISTIKKREAIENIIKEKVIEVIREIFTDPDYGLELKPDFVKRLKKSIEAEKKGKTVPLDKILKKYNF